MVSCCGGVMALCSAASFRRCWAICCSRKTQNSYMDCGAVQCTALSGGHGAFLFSALLGIIFGLYPANKASNLQPVDVLRTQ
ncbi:MAG: ABC transporter permease [Butyricicoccus sp.]